MVWERRREILGGQRKAAVHVVCRNIRPGDERWVKCEPGIVHRMVQTTARSVGRECEEVVAYANPSPAKLLSVNHGLE